MTDASKEIHLSRKELSDVQFELEARDELNLVSLAQDFAEKIINIYGEDIISGAFAQREDFQVIEVRIPEIFGNGGMTIQYALFTDNGQVFLTYHETVAFSADPHKAIKQGVVIGQLAMYTHNEMTKQLSKLVNQID